MSMIRHAVVCLIVLFAATCACTAFAQEMPEGRLMRFPDIYKDKVVFSYGGDLWLSSASGGVSRRITTHPGLEIAPKFSPDGKWIAFSAQYDGNFNIYVIPAEGGEPNQLTFETDPVHLPERMGLNNQVITWLPDGKRILYLSRRDTFNDWFGRLFTISVDGGLPERLPVDKGGLTSFSPDGNQIVFNRIFRNFRTWKRYTGGMAQKISIYDLKTNHYEQIGDYDGTDTFPMWRGDTIYFDSDRGPDHRMNLYSYSLKSKEIRQVTHFTDWDVNWPSAGPDSIIFENAGYLYTVDLNGGQPKKLTIYLPGDRDFVRKHWDNVSKLTTAFDISPDGKRAVLNSRGNLYTVPAKQGSIRALTQTPGIRELYSAWSPDGKWIAYISDRTGEDEFYIIPQDGMGKEIRITTDGKMFRLQPVWSPDSTKLLFSDKSLRLFYVDINEKKPVLIDQGKYAGDLTDYSWSPDSRWAAYAKGGENLFGVIYLYSLADKKITPVTTSFTTSSNPVFDQNGKYLYFLSARDYNEVIGAFDFEVAVPKPVRVYAVTLRADLPSPFSPQSDEVSVKKPDVESQGAADQKKDDQKKDEKKDAKKDEKKDAAKDDSKEKPEPFRIDLPGIGGRVVGLPIPPGNLGGLAAAKDAVYYISQPVIGLSGPLPGEPSAIHIFDMKERKDHTLLTPINGYALSFDGKKLLYAAPREGASDDDQGGNTAYGIIDATVPSDGPHKVGEGALDLSSMRAEIDPAAEWKQMFYEVYRQERDYFFEASMNGVDWDAQRDKYAQLLPYVADRYDLTYIFGELIGELSNSHTYAGGGDYPNLKPVSTGFLGVDYELDSSSGRYRFKRILPGENWNDALRSPLTEPGVDVKPGDYLLAVNGRELRAPQSPYELFSNTAGQNVTLTVNSKPAEEGSRRVTVKPIASEYKLHELDWIDTNRRKVDEATKGRVGYVFLPDMEDVGLNEFFKQWFPQVRKEGMIIDVRYNGGGFVDQIIFERLRRIVLGMGTSRNFGSAPNPDPAFYGSMACITNEYAASDGDFFTYYFKLYKLGPVIGMRTWGGVRGIRGNIPLLDGGYVTRPEFSLYDMNSQWVIENKGVQPDIVIDNTPDQVMAGHDPQLEKAIEVVLKQIQEHPKTLPPRPPDLPAYPTKPGQ